MPDAIVRYEVGECGSWGVMFDTPDGAWVLYAAHRAIVAALEAELATLRAAARAVIPIARRGLVRIEEMDTCLKADAARATIDALAAVVGKE